MSKVGHAPAGIYSDDGKILEGVANLDDGSIFRLIREYPTLAALQAAYAASPQNGIAQSGATPYVTSSDGTIGRINFDNPGIYSYVGIGDGTNESVAINNLLQLAGPGATIKFNPDIEMTIRGRILPLAGQELIDLNIKRANQITSLLTVALNNGATSATVGTTNIALFNRGDSLVIASDSTDSPASFSSSPVKVTDINTSTGVLYFDMPVALVNQAGGTEASLAIGTALIGTGGPLIGNRNEAGVTVPSGIKITRPIINGNKANNAALAFWQIASDIDLLCHDLEIYKPKLTNSYGEGLVFSGNNPVITLLDIDGSVGNGWHASAYSATEGVRNGQIVGGSIRNTNDAPPVSGSVGTVTYATGTDTLSGLPDSSVKSLVGAVIAKDSDNSVIGTIKTHLGTTGTLHATTTTNGALASHIVATGSVVDRFLNRRNIGHRGGGGTLSNNVFGLKIKAVTHVNCYSGIGQIDGLDNTDVDIVGNTFINCGTYSDSLGSSRGGIDVSNTVGGGAQRVNISGNYFQDNYAMRIGMGTPTNLANKCSVAMDSNKFVDSPVEFNILNLAHTSGTYVARRGTTGSTPVVTYPGCDGVLNGVVVDGGYRNMSIVCNNATINNALTISNYVLTNGWFNGIFFSGNYSFGGNIGIGTISTAAGAYFGNTNGSTSYVGIDMASGGGKASDIHIDGAVIDIATQCYAGIRIEPATNFDMLNSTVANVTVKLRGAVNAADQTKGVPVKVATASNLPSNVAITNMGSYPNLVTTGWPGTVTSTGWHAVTP